MSLHSTLGLCVCFAYVLVFRCLFFFALLTQDLVRIFLLHRVLPP